MTPQRPALPASEAEFLEWSRRWEAARSRAGLSSMAAMAAGVLGGMALQHAVVRALLPHPWPALATSVVMLVGFALGGWLRWRNEDRALAALGKMCGGCERIIHDSRAVVKNGGRCTECGDQLYAPAA
jgi:uncharacterized membrane protein AbrB (regulator of aidB expression)